MYIQGRRSTDTLTATVGESDLSLLTSCSFSAPFLTWASDAVASRPRRMGASKFFLNSAAVPSAVDQEDYTLALL